MCFTDVLNRLDKIVNTRQSDVAENKCVVDRGDLAKLIYYFNRTNMELRKCVERLQVSPYGDDKIDELEESLFNVKHELEVNQSMLEDIRYKYEELIISYSEQSKIIDALDKE